MMTVAVAIFVAACGRATQQDIDSALGITPTATMSADDIATSTAKAAAAAMTAANASPDSIAAIGNVTQGGSAFQFNCMQCHRVDGAGRGPVLSGPSSPALALTDDQIADLIRNSTNHTPPGPYQTFQINDQRIADLVAYLRSISQ